MKSYSAYFVRAAALEAAQAVFGASVQPLPDSPWLLCAYQPDDELPDEDVLRGETSLTQAKSAALGEVFFVYGDTSVDWFVYEHAQDGELLRKLVWATLPEGDWDDCGWALAEGAPEAWEAALFRADGLARHLENEAQRLQDEGRGAEVAAMQADAEKLWAAKQITAGQTLPMGDGTVAMLVEKSYGIDRFQIG
jgi:hypothetical protein